MLAQQTAQTAQEKVLMERSDPKYVVEMVYNGPNTPLAIRVTERYDKGSEVYTITPEHQDCVMDCFNHPFCDYWQNQRDSAPWLESL